MPKINQNFDLYKDSHLVIHFLFEDDENLNIHSAVWVMNRNNKNHIIKTLDDGITISSNTITISLTPDDTKDLQNAPHYHELRITKEGNLLTSPVSMGTVKVNSVLTQSDYSE